LTRERLSLLTPLVLLSGALWGGLLFFVGMEFLGSQGAAWIGHGRLGGALVGVTAIAGGQFVFAIIVADRLFPSAAKRIAISAKLALGAVFGLGAVASGVMLLTGAS
jgi:hypothetical protein